MAFEEFWIGKGINLEEVWSDFEQGESYIHKFQSRPVHLITFDFDNNKSAPLYNHEAIFKTIKFYFHELKVRCLSPSAYNESLPLFLYEVERGSTLDTFAGELAQLVFLGTTLTEQEVIEKQINNFDRKLEIAKKFGIEPKTFAGQWEAFLKAKSSRDLQFAMNRLLSNGLKEIHVSEKPLTNDPKQAKASMRSLGKIDYLA